MMPIEAVIKEVEYELSAAMAQSIWNLLWDNQAASALAVLMQCEGHWLRLEEAQAYIDQALPKVQRAKQIDLQLAAASEASKKPPMILGAVSQDQADELERIARFAFADEVELIVQGPVDEIVMRRGGESIRILGCALRIGPVGPR